jgi:hypothetical protein
MTDEPAIPCRFDRAIPAHRSIMRHRYICERRHAVCRNPIQKCCAVLLQSG